MQRRTFLAALGAASAAAATLPIEAALLTHEDGPHLSAYIEALAHASEIGSVSLCDPSGKTESVVRKGLGAKLIGAYRDKAALFAVRKPALALITMEGKLSPPAIASALGAGCHVMAEKPACIRAEDFAPLAARAEA